LNPVDNHSHILLADILEMVDAARKNGLVEFSITEHVSQFREIRDSVRFASVHPNGRIFKNLKEYNDEFEKIDRSSQSMRVNRGLEVDFSPRYEARVGDFVNQDNWDLLLCSVHELEDGREIENRRREIEPKEAHRRWRDYLALEQKALESDFVPFHVLSHPVRMARATDIVPPELDNLLVDLARTAKRKNKALELNGNDIDYSPQLVRRLASASSEAGCRVSLGSDAHYPKYVFKNLRIAISLVDDYNLKS
jgi:HisJ family histidinol phosphate phosphatase